LARPVFFARWQSSWRLLHSCLELRVKTISTTTVTAQSTSWKRSLVSVLLFAHLFCAVVALSVGFMPSPLGMRFLERMGLYTQILCLDPRFAHPQLTVGTSELNRDFSDDVVFDLTLSDSNLTLPTPGVGQWTGSNRRYAQLALAIAKAADPETENEAAAAGLARGVALEAMAATGSDRATLEVVRWRSQSNILEPNEAEDPSSPSYKEVLYTVDIVRKADGKVVVSKHSPKRDVAPPPVIIRPDEGAKGDSP
jgi:hypothetical protein